MRLEAGAGKKTRERRNGRARRAQPAIPVPGERQCRAAIPAGGARPGLRWWNPRKRRESVAE